MKTRRLAVAQGVRGRNCLAVNISDVNSDQLPPYASFGNSGTRSLLHQDFRPPRSLKLEVRRFDGSNPMGGY